MWCFQFMKYSIINPSCNFMEGETPDHASLSSYSSNSSNHVSSSLLKSRFLKGRKPNPSTLILQKFCNVNRSSPLKLEYLRAFFVRLIKKLIRLTIENRKPHSFMIKFARNRHLFNCAQNIVKLNIEAAEAMNLGSTNTDPSKIGSTQSSFNFAFTKEFYSIPFISEAHDFLVKALLDNPNIDQINDYLKITLKQSGDTWLADIMELRDFLMSDKFKGQEITKTASQDRVSTRGITDKAEETKHSPVGFTYGPRILGKTRVHRVE